MGSIRSTHTHTHQPKRTHKHTTHTHSTHTPTKAHAQTHNTHTAHTHHYTHHTRNTHKPFSRRAGETWIECHPQAKPTPLAGAWAHHSVHGAPFAHRQLLRIAQANCLQSNALWTRRSRVLPLSAAWQAAADQRRAQAQNVYPHAPSTHGTRNQHGHQRQCCRCHDPLSCHPRGKT